MVAWNDCNVHSSKMEEENIPGDHDHTLTSTQLPPMAQLLSQNVMAPSPGAVVAMG